VEGRRRKRRGQMYSMRFILDNHDEVCVYITIHTFAGEREPSRPCRIDRCPTSANTAKLPVLDRQRLDLVSHSISVP
jgi:hypothetical protein